MYVCFKYFSRQRNKICSNFLGIIEVEHVTAEELFKKIKLFLDKIGLNTQHMIGIGTDSANNLCGKHHLLYSLLRKEDPKIQLVRCICPSLNISKRLEVIPSLFSYMSNKMATQI